MSYTIPESPVEEQSDIEYDGKRELGLLSGGVGRLIDGDYGVDNYRVEISPGRGESPRQFRQLKHSYIHSVCECNKV